MIFIPLRCFIATAYFLLIIRYLRMTIAAKRPQQELCKIYIWYGVLQSIY